MNNGLSSLSPPDASGGAARFIRSSARPTRGGPGRRPAAIECSHATEASPSTHAPATPAPLLAPPARNLLLLQYPQERVTALVAAGQALGTRVAGCWQAHLAWAAGLVPRHGLGSWNLPLAPPAFWPRLTVPADAPSAGLLSYAAAALVLLDGQVAAAVPPLPPVAASSPLLLPFLVPVDQVEISHAALLSDLSNAAYEVDQVTSSRLREKHNLYLVATSACVPRATSRPSSAMRGGSDAVVIAAAVAGVAAAAAAAFDAPPPMLLLPAAAAEATAAAVAASPPSSPLAAVSLLSSASTANATSADRLGQSLVDLSSPTAAAATLSSAHGPPHTAFLSVDDTSNSASRRLEGQAQVHPARSLAATVSHAAASQPSMGGQRPQHSAPLPAASAGLRAVHAPTASLSSHSLASSSAASGSDGGAASAAAVPEDALCSVAAPPTAWFCADDEARHIRHFVLQGSTNFEHWMINMQFVPVVFEDPALGVRIHRGVYDTACLMYDDLLPLVRQHMATSPFATISLTGHSLGGSLATVLMLLFIGRGELAPRSIAPVYTFGAPAVFCQSAVGDDADPAMPTGRCSACALSCELSGQAFASMTPSSYSGGALAAAGHALGNTWASVTSGEAGCPRATGLLKALMLAEEHVVNVIMHKDIVPRAFVCDYSLVAEMLKSWSPSFQDHASLQDGQDKSMYGFIGRVAVLRPDDACSFVNKDADHAMLPPQPALYKMMNPPPPGHPRHQDSGGAASREQQGSVAASAEDAPATAKEALVRFMSSPHPLSVLADYRSYGTNGGISRYHNPDHYTQALRKLLA